MIPIFIDSKSLSQEFLLEREEIDSMMDIVVKDVTAQFAQKWQDEALRTLKSSKEDYAKNIILVDEGFCRGAVVLTGWLPNAIEGGLDPYDQKEGILSGSKAKIGKNGARYNTIPFRLGNPSSVGDSALFSTILPQEVYNIVKSKPQNILMQSGSMRTEGIKVNELPSQYREPTIRVAPKELKSSFKDYERKFSVYAGASKIKDNVTGQNRYMTFRRVSDNSDINSWIHSGITARNLAESALENLRMDHIIGRSVDNFLISKGYV